MCGFEIQHFMCACVCALVSNNITVIRGATFLCALIGKCVYNNYWCRLPCLICTSWLWCHPSKSRRASIRTRWWDSSGTPGRPLELFSVVLQFSVLESLASTNEPEKPTKNINWRNFWTVQLTLKTHQINNIWLAKKSNCLSIHQLKNITEKLRLIFQANCFCFL